jgi:hypothetical protein
MRGRHTSTTRCGSSRSSRPRASSNLDTGDRRAGGYFLLEGSSIDAVRERVDTLPFVTENLMTVEYDEICEI